MCGDTNVVNQIAVFCMCGDTNVVNQIAVIAIIYSARVIKISNKCD